MRSIPAPSASVGTNEFVEWDAVMSTRIVCAAVNEPNITSGRRVTRERWTECLILIAADIESPVQCARYGTKPLVFIRSLNTDGLGVVYGGVLWSAAHAKF